MLFRRIFVTMNSPPLGPVNLAFQVASNVQQVDGGVAVPKNLSSLRMIVLSFVTSVNGSGFV